MRIRKNAWIWIKAEYTDNGIKQLVGCIYNPYLETGKQVISGWVLPGFRNQCFVTFTD